MAGKSIFNKLLVLGLFLSSIPLQAQSIESLLERYTGKNATGYIEPLVTAFGANVNSGWYYQAAIPQRGFHFNIRLNAVATLFKDDSRTFMATTEGAFRPEKTVETSTIIGSPQGASVEGENGTTFTFPGGYDINSFALAVPTVTVGSIYGTEASLRYFSTTATEDIGKIELFGYGIRHNISQYIPLSPVDIAAGFGYTRLDVGDIVSASGIILHANVGKKFSVAHVYGGMAYESSKAEINYTFSQGGDNQQINIDVDGKNKFRFTIGAGLNLFFLHLNVDYNIGDVNVVNGGVSLGL
jgi:hypothetical protein